jgi:hypothetical protein
MAVVNKYASRIDKPTVYTTSKGARYVRPFDILRSESGRAVINRLAEDELGNTSSEKKSYPDEKIAREAKK